MIGAAFLFLALMLPCIALAIEADRLARNTARRAEGRATIPRDYGATALLLSAGFACLMIARVAAAGAAQ
jgi:hypothetical protein